MSKRIERIEKIKDVVKRVFPDSNFYISQTDWSDNQPLTIMPRDATYVRISPRQMDYLEELSGEKVELIYSNDTRQSTYIKFSIHRGLREKQEMRNMTDVEFSYIMRAALQKHNALDLSDMFDIGSNLIVDFAAGVKRPLPMMQKSMIKTIREKLF